MSNRYTEQIKKQVKKTSALLEKLGFVVAEKQLHIFGEREVLSQEKLVLEAFDAQNKKVMVKCSNTKAGIREIKKEKKIRDSLTTVSYSNDSIALPREVFYGSKNGYLFFITEFIPQDKIFVEHSLKEQFFMAMTLFERQESFHATTSEHLRSVQRTCSIFKKDTYIQNILFFYKKLQTYKNITVQNELKRGFDFFIKNADIIDTYCGYLIHEDIVPHNFRIKNNQLYILDYSSLQYAHKYESWARFLNYMVIHNPSLEQMIKKYLRTKRSEREYRSLQVMRIYKLFQLLFFYNNLLAKVDGNLLKLTKIRIAFWAGLIKHVIADTDMPKGVLRDYKAKRDRLRTSGEKERQREFAIA